MPAVPGWGERAPAETGADMPAASGDGAGSGWWHRVAAVGPRPDCILPDPYPPGRSPDRYLPLDRALNQRDATGDTAPWKASSAASGPSRAGERT